MFFFLLQTYQYSRHKRKYERRYIVKLISMWWISYAWQQISHLPHLSCVEIRKKNWNEIKCPKWWTETDIMFDVWLLVGLMMLLLYNVCSYFVWLAPYCINNNNGEKRPRKEIVCSYQTAMHRRCSSVHLFFLIMGKNRHHLSPDKCI